MVQLTRIDNPGFKPIVSVSNYIWASENNPSWQDPGQNTPLSAFLRQLLNEIPSDS